MPAPLCLNTKSGIEKVDVSWVSSMCLYHHTQLVWSRCMQVHPLVLFNILDHYIRRNEGQDRVIGTLLGVQSGSNSVTVTNSFPVPHSEGEQVSVFVDGRLGDTLQVH